MRQAEKMIMYKSDSAKPSADPPHHMKHSPSLSASGGCAFKTNRQQLDKLQQQITTLGLDTEASRLYYQKQISFREQDLKRSCVMMHHG